MQTELENLKLVLSSPRPRAPNTLTNYLSVANQFLTWLGSRIPPDDMDLRRYFLERREKGIGENTLRTEFAILKKLYLANHWEFQFTADDRPEASAQIDTPAFTSEEVAGLIKNRELYSRGEQFYLAIATIYAPRRIELARIKTRYIKGNTLYIDTAKHGEKRTHLIPEEIMPYIEAYRPRENNVASLTALFDRVCVKGLGKKKKGYGFHSFRRCLATLLPIALAKADKPLTYVGYYLRWNMKSVGAQILGTPMAGLYARPQILSDDPYFIDREVLSVHPFLPLWVDKGQ